jgi:hypothetical protein
MSDGQSKAEHLGFAEGDPRNQPDYGKKDDPVDHPSHYNKGKFEVIDVIDDWKLAYCEANAVKYIARAEHKGKQIEDLKKAVWYLQFRIARLELAGKDTRWMQDR